MSNMSKIIRADLLTLNDGNKMPCVALGTYQGEYDYKKRTEMAKAACESAIDLGYRHFDTATEYQTEEGVGAAIKQKIKEGVVTREEVFVTTKLWSTSHRQHLVIPALKKSLVNFGLDYVDLYLIHWPIAMPPSDSTWPVDQEGNLLFEDDKISLTETWLGMEECKKLGLARSIGISNFNEKQIQEILNSCSIKPAVNQIEVHPFLQSPELVDFCSSQGIVVTGYSPLGKPQRGWAAKDDPNVFTNPFLTEIGQKYKKTSSQIFDFLLTNEEVSAIKALDRNFRATKPDSVLKGSINYPYTE